MPVSMAVSEVTTVNCFADVTVRQMCSFLALLLLGQTCYFWDCFNWRTFLCSVFFLLVFIVLIDFLLILKVSERGQLGRP